MSAPTLPAFPVSSQIAQRSQQCITWLFISLAALAVLVMSVDAFLHG